MKTTCPKEVLQDPSPTGDIHFEFDGVPPTTNHAYLNNPFGGRTLSAEGRSYKQCTAALVTQHYPMLLRQVEKNVPYLVVVRFFMQVASKGWPKKSNARYKRFDVDNRLKLLLDALSEAFGIDDSQFLKVYVEKQESVTERTEVWLWNLEKEVRNLAQLIHQATG